MRAGHCMHHRQCACAPVFAEKLSVARNLLLLFGRLLLERRGASADLHGEVDFCRSTRGFFTSCSSTWITTRSSRASRCRRRHIVDHSSAPAAFVVRRPPRTEFRVHFACSTPARVSHASHSLMHPTCTATHHPQGLTPPPRPHFCHCAMGCGVPTPPPSLSHRSTPLRSQVVILDFSETFSSSSRRWSRHFLPCDSFLLPDSWRAVCVIDGTGVASRAAVRGVHIFARIVMLVLLKYRSIKRMGLICTLADAEGTPTRPRQLCVCMPWKGTRH